MHTDNAASDAYASTLRHIQYYTENDYPPSNDSCFLEKMLSAFNLDILELDFSDLHYNTQDWSSAKVTPENVEWHIRLQNMYFVITLCYTLTLFRQRKVHLYFKHYVPSPFKIIELITKIHPTTMRHTI
jgi:hypothetical protein